MSASQRAASASLRTGVLLVEDDARIRQALGLALADAGYDIMEAATGEQALTRLDSADVDLIVLDVMLPGVDGLTICRTVRARSELPIIIITARSDTSDVIEGLEAGADDYMAKPVVASELAARIRALLRRRRSPPTAAPTSNVQVGDIEVLLDQGVARRGRQDVHLTRTEFRLLAELATAAGRVVSREELLQQVWGYDYFGDTRLLDVHIRRLRRKVETDPDHPVLVLTVRGVGYRMGIPE
jgi:DNA-binding response OmpR family regulator